MAQASTRTRQDLINTGEAFGARTKGASQDKLAGWGEGEGGGGGGGEAFKSSGKRRLGEFCFSLSNVILIVASVIALCVLIKFVQDDPLYEYGEHLLSLRFYRQLIYIMIVLFFVLLLPIANTLAALLLSKRYHTTSGLLRLKLAYQLLLCLLLLVALFFIAPYVRASNLSSQLELELRKHMKYRYEKQFSYELLDMIQETYECCDEFWYRANLNDHLPLSCFIPNTNTSQIYDQTCANALGSLISVRCSLIAACLLVLLGALASLFAIDLIGLLSRPADSRRYEVGGNAQSAQRHHRAGSFQRRDEERDTTAEQQQREQTTGTEREGRRPPVMIGGQEDPINELLRKEPSRPPSAAPPAVVVGQNRLRQGERQRQVPLLRNTDLDRPADDDDEAAAGHQSLNQLDQLELDNDRETMPPGAASYLRQSPDCFQHIDQEEDERAERNQAETRRQEPVVLARADLRLVERERSQSPLLAPAAAPLGAPGVARPIKSALKKSPSSQQLGAPGAGGADGNSSADDADSGSFHFRRGSRDTDADSLDEYADKLRQSNSLLRQKGLQREQATRRSLLSVRFAE